MNEGRGAGSASGRGGGAPPAAGRGGGGGGASAASEGCRVYKPPLGRPLGAFHSRSMLLKLSSLLLYFSRRVHSSLLFSTGLLYSCTVASPKTMFVTVSPCRSTAMPLSTEESAVQRLMEIIKPTEEMVCPRTSFARTPAESFTRRYHNFENFSIRAGSQIRTIPDASSRPRSCSRTPSSRTPS